MNKPEPVFGDLKMDHGEGPVWDYETGTLYWVDIAAGQFLKGQPGRNDIQKFNVGQPIGVLALRENGGPVIGLRDGFGIWNEETQQPYLVFTLPVNDNIRFNDGAVDPSGRFFAGTMNMKGDAPVGNLYSINPDKETKILKEEMYIPNGMGWSPNGETFYLTDTPRHVIYAYDYNPENGTMHNERIFIQFGNDENPDGMCIDMEENFWVALWGGKKIVRFDKKGNRIDEIPIPVLQPTSCCFGGEKMNILYITTSRRDLNQEQRKEYPLAGKIFMLETDTKGQKQRRFKG